MCRAAGATSRVMEEAMSVVIAKASQSKEAFQKAWEQQLALVEAKFFLKATAFPQAVQSSTNLQKEQQNDQEDRVKELMKARRSTAVLGARRGPEPEKGTG